MKRKRKYFVTNILIFFLLPSEQIGPGAAVQQIHQKSKVKEINV